MALLTRLGGNQLEFEKEKAAKQESGKNSLNLAVRLHNFLVEELKKPVNQGKHIELLVENLSNNFFEEEGNYLTFEQKKRLIHDISHELTGYGPISPLLADPNVTEVMVNGPNNVYIEVNGRIEKTNIQFRDNSHVLHIIEKIITPFGRRIDESNPMVDARLPDGSRVNAIIPPLALNGPTITIRKSSEVPFTIYDLLRMGTLNENMAHFLKAAVEAKLNIFISGDKGSGKTSTLNVLSAFIPRNERIVTIEAAAELKLLQEHVISLESRPGNIEGQGEVSIRDLVRNSVRMRPDRVIIGELRSEEALDMLQAMNTGHDGSLGTVHANSPKDLIGRLETMVLMAGYDLPVRAIREQIAGSLDLIVHQARMKDGSRKIVRITEVLGLEGDTIVLQDIFLYNERKSASSGKVEGQFTPSGNRPNCISMLELPDHNLEAMFKAEW